MASLQITCVNRTGDTHEHITYLGGSSWAKKTRAQVVSDIETGANSFYTMVNGKRADVGVRTGTHGKYVQSHADGYYNNNLLALGSCS